jgi:hypothetical protein
LKANPLAKKFHNHRWPLWEDMHEIHAGLIVKGSCAFCGGNATRDGPQDNMADEESEDKNDNGEEEEV